MRGIVVAYDLEGGIGKNGDLLWEHGTQRRDMQRFTALTTGEVEEDGTGHNSVIMGNTTFNSIPEKFRPFSGRQNIVLTRKALSETVAIDTVTWASSLGDAYSQADGSDVWVIGGAEVYRQALPTVNRVLASRVLKPGSGADTFFPTLDLEEEWELADEVEDLRTDARNQFGVIFSTYIRRSPIEE